MHFIRQGQAPGLGHAVACGHVFVGAEPFFVALPDDLVVGAMPALQQLREAQAGGTESVIALQRVPLSDVSRNGVVELDENGLIRRMVEKPRPEDTPSNLAVVGRYLLQPEIFACLDSITPRGGR